jgi:hypothetical protein
MHACACARERGPGMGLWLFIYQRCLRLYRIQQRLIRPPILRRAHAAAAQEARNPQPARAPQARAQCTPHMLVPREGLGCDHCPLPSIPFGGRFEGEGLQINKPTLGRHPLTPHHTRAGLGHLYRPLQLVRCPWLERADGSHQFFRGVGFGGRRPPSSTAAACKDMMCDEGGC